MRELRARANAVGRTAPSSTAAEEERGEGTSASEAQTQPRRARPLPRSGTDAEKRCGAEGGVAIAYLNYWQDKHLAEKLKDFLQMNKQTVPRWLDEMGADEKRSREQKEAREKARLSQQAASLSIIPCHVYMVLESSRRAHTFHLITRHLPELTRCVVPDRNLPQVIHPVFETCCSAE